MDEDSSSSATPTALVKIFGDFDTRVRTASRRTGENFGTRQAGSSLLSSDLKSGHNNLLGRKSSFATNPKGRLVFDELDTPQGQTSSRQKRPSSVLYDPLTGLENYPKAMRTDDTRTMQAEIGKLIKRKILLFFKCHLLLISELLWIFFFIMLIFFFQTD